jgi:hypothetical protein
MIAHSGSRTLVGSNLADHYGFKVNAPLQIHWGLATIRARVSSSANPSWAMSDLPAVGEVGTQPKRKCRVVPVGRANQILFQFLTEDYPWFALWARSRSKNIITAELNGKGYECFPPLHKTRRRWSGRFKESEQHTHLLLATDSPEPRPILSPELGEVIEQPQLEGFTTATNGEPHGLPLRGIAFLFISWLGKICVCGCQSRAP